MTTTLSPAYRVLVRRRGRPLHRLAGAARCAGGKAATQLWRPSYYIISFFRIPRPPTSARIWTHAHLGIHLGSPRRTGAFFFVEHLRPRSLAASTGDSIAEPHKILRLMVTWTKAAQGAIIVVLLLYCFLEAQRALQPSPPAADPTPPAASSSPTGKFRPASDTDDMNRGVLKVILHEVCAAKE